MTILTFDDVAENYKACPSCKAQMWEAWKPEEQAMAFRAMTEAGYADANPAAKAIINRVQCDECEKSAQAKKAQQKRMAKYQRLVDAGKIRNGMERYAKPPAKLVSLNVLVWEWARKRFDVNGGHVLVHGPEGVGKSSLCRSMLCQAIEAGFGAMEICAARFEYALWRFDHEYLVHECQRVRVLLIDDVGAVPWTPRGLGVLRQVMDARHEGRKAMLVTSNLPPKALLDKFARVTGDKVFAESLLRRMQPLKELTMTGESFRQSMTYGTGLKTKKE